MFDRIGFLADFARQISGIAAGGTFKTKIVNNPEGDGWRDSGGSA
jgi:hypothetical protein